MTDQHPITPPPELVEDWLGQWPQDALLQAARWGADQELKACCEWVNDDLAYDVADRLRSARRSKMPSLKERALQAWSAVMASTDDQTAMAVIRRALEALPE